MQSLQIYRDGKDDYKSYGFKSLRFSEQILYKLLNDQNLEMHTIATGFYSESPI